MNATATMAPTDRAGGPQYMRALERANQVRLARASLKRRIALGETRVAAVILDCPWEAESMAVADLLMSQRRWGQTRCRKFLAQLAMSEKKTVGSMTDRQRRTLAAMLTAVPSSGCEVTETSEVAGAEAQRRRHDDHQTSESDRADRAAALEDRPFEGISAHRAPRERPRAMALSR
jgi:hypothetical protein